MAISQRKSKRKATGGKYRTWRKKKLGELGRLPTLTRIAKRKITKIRVIGANSKIKTFFEETANIYDPKTKKHIKAKIIAVVENPANRNYARRNIITKGTIIETDKGKAKVTNRPGQDAGIQAILQ
ncbi:MAG: 30S ribosomal protein S8e [Candidatus Nanoarchaeia archaeon]|nr:30S ribosomal protein S8e [Candidatus Nanoarchaeia archaeon]